MNGQALFRFRSGIIVRKLRFLRYSCASIEVRVVFLKFIINSLARFSLQHGGGVDILA